MNPETAQAILDCAKADVVAEDDRMKVLDDKLSTLATFSGLSVSISASLGANVLVARELDVGFTIALGVTLTAAVVMLLLTTLTAFRGLRPKEYRGLTLDSAKSRVTPRRLRADPAEAMAVLAATYYTDILPAARSANNVKLEKVGDAFRYARIGLIGLVVAVVLTATGAVVQKGSENERDARSTGWTAGKGRAASGTAAERPRSANPR